MLYYVILYYEKRRNRYLIALLQATVATWISLTLQGISFLPRCGSFPNNVLNPTSWSFHQLDSLVIQISSLWKASK